jgi:carboxymethylenebutenolidase
MKHVSGGLLASASMAAVSFLFGQSTSAEAGLETISIKTASGRTITAILAVPTITPAPAVVTIHGSWGFSPWYKSLPGEYAKEGFVGLSVDLFDGEVATDQARGDTLQKQADSHPLRTRETLVTWIEWLKQDQRTNGRVALVGYSFGAMMALETAMNVPIDAAVLYYGVIDAASSSFQALHGPMLGHFAEQDFHASCPDGQAIGNADGEGR